jgi:limonene 1,2-monooxygenase
MPRFTGSADRLLKSQDYAVSRWQELDGRQADAIAQATERHARERAAATASH